MIGIIVENKGIYFAQKCTQLRKYKIIAQTLDIVKIFSQKILVT